MAAVAGVRSTLNPNAPVFIPAAFRLVEDFSPEWWSLVKTSPWYRDYWLSEHQEEGFDSGGDENEEDILDLLPESVDLGFDDEVEVRFAELVAESEVLEKKEQKEVEAKALLRSLSLPKSPNEKSTRSFSPKYNGEKAPKFVGPKSPTLRRIQQPR